MFQRRKKEIAIKVPAMGATIQNTAVTLEVTQAINDGLNSIPPVPGVEIPGQGKFLPSLGQTVLSGLAFVGSALSLKETWDSAKDLYCAKNKNFTKVANLAVNLFRTAVVGVFFAGLITGAAYALPILLPLSAALGAAWGLFTAGKKAYQAYKAHRDGDKEKRNTLLKESGLNIISAALNGLGAYASLAVTGIASALKSSSEMFLHGIKNLNFIEIGSAINLTQSAGRVYEAFKPVAYALGALLTLGTASTFVANTNRQFDQALHTLAHPKESLNNVGKSFVNKVTETGNFIKKTYGLGVIAVPLMLALEVTSLALSAAAGIAQFALAATAKFIFYVGSKIGSFIKNLFVSNEAPAVAEKNVADVEKIDINLQQRALYDRLKSKVKAQQEHLSKQANDPKHAAKKHVVTEVENSLGDTFETYRPTNIVAIEKRSREISPLVSQSFFRDVSRTDEIIALTKELNRSLAPGQ